MSLEVSSSSPFVEIYLNIVAKGQGGEGLAGAYFTLAKHSLDIPFTDVNE